MGQIRHSTPSLRLFVPNSLRVHHFSFLLRFLIVTSLSLIVSGFFSFFLLYDVHSPTTTTAPSLRALVPSGTLIRFQSVQVIIIIQNVLLFSLPLSLPTVGAMTSGVAGAPTHPALTPCTISLFVPEGADTSTTFDPCIPAVPCTLTILSLSATR
jgi:hypothetical protein